MVILCIYATLTHGRAVHECDCCHVCVGDSVAYTLQVTAAKTGGDACADFRAT